jgi:RNA polymerase sigma-70 factor, ECF subfamily
VTLPWPLTAARRQQRSGEARSPDSPGGEELPGGSLPIVELIAALPRLRRYARVLTGDGNRADDLVQDTLARAWEKRGLWLAGSNLRAWLFTIMHNVHLNQFVRRRYEQAETSLDTDNGPAGGWEVADDGPAAGWDISVRATQSDRVELAEVLMHIERLPAEQRDVLMLAAVEELRYDEIARIQGIPIGTVMSRLNRGRQKLRHMLAEPPARLKMIK